MSKSNFNRWAAVTGMIFLLAQGLVACIGHAAPTSGDADRIEGSVGGGDTVPAVISKKLFDELIGWIGVHTSYDLMLAYRTPVTMSFCDVGQSVEYEGSNLIVKKGLRAAYDASRRHVYLVRPWSAVSVVDQSILLHELIHDVQVINEKWDCYGASELEAYIIQSMWLAEHGIQYKLEWDLILELSRCSPVV